MELTITSSLLILSAASSLCMAVVMLVRNHRRATHVAFAVLCTHLAIWTLGVLSIIHTRRQEDASFWLHATFAIACFIPATFYQFIGYFPRGRFDGRKWMLAFFYCAASCLVLAALLRHSWYIEALIMSPDPARHVEVQYGPIFQVFVALYAFAAIAVHANLIKKLRQASGIARRQIQHVLLGIFSMAVFSTLTNVLAPALGVRTLEAYGPVFVVLMMASFAYAMIRYHLMDIWVIISRTTVYAIVTGIVIVIFLSSISLVHWAFRSATGPGDVLPTVLAAFVVAIVLQPLKEQIQLILNRVVLKRQYDVKHLLARTSQMAAEIVQFDRLLKSVSDDIQNTVGASIIRVLLVDEKDDSLLTVEYSSDPEERGKSTRDFAVLADYVRAHPGPLVLEELVHARLTEERARIAEILAENDAYLCLPLKRTTGLVGIMTLGQKRSHDIYTADDVMVFTALATPLATAIENARLYKQLEEANLHRSRILSSMRGGVVAVDTEGQVTMVNRCATDVLGPITVGRSIQSVNPQVARILEQTIRDRRAIGDFETIISHPNGERVPVVISSSCLTSSDNELTGAMVVVYDLSQVKRLEQNVQRAHRLSSIGTLAAGMAHEIKNPLVSIKTFTQLLLDRYNDPDFRTTFSDIVPHEVERIDSIVTRLLHFARPRPASFAPQNLRAIIEEVLTLVENQTRKECVAVEMEFSSAHVEVYGDEQQLHQVFLNLVLNAIDAMSESKTRTLRIKVEHGHMRLRRHGYDPLPEVECVKISVSDTGCGVHSDSLDRIFTPFYTTKHDGTGLGLSVVHGIVTEHQGDIYVESAPGEGTTFIITLPQIGLVAEMRGV